MQLQHYSINGRNVSLLQYDVCAYVAVSSLYFHQGTLEKPVLYYNKLSEFARFDLLDLNCYLHFSLEEQHRE